jgi:hypothetical protein
MLRAEKALPDEVLKMKRDKDAQASLSQWRVLETREEIAEYESASTSIQVGLDLLENMDRIFSTRSLFVS